MVMSSASTMMPFVPAQNPGSMPSLIDVSTWVPQPVIMGPGFGVNADGQVITGEHCVAPFARARLPPPSIPFGAKMPLAVLPLATFPANVVTALAVKKPEPPLPTAVLPLTKLSDEDETFTPTAPLPITRLPT